MPVLRNRLRSSTSTTLVAPNNISRDEQRNRNNQQQAPPATAASTSTATPTTATATTTTTTTAATIPTTPIPESETPTSVTIPIQNNTKNNGLSQRRNFNILLAVTGSVASIKLIELIRKLSAQFPQTYVSKTDNRTYQATISIRVLMTEHSKHFVSRHDIINSLESSPQVEVFEDADEWSQWKKMGDPVLHIELRKWADICVIAPLDANTMAKIANGLCDNLITCVVRAWDTTKKLIYCPAMNVHMYNHPVTKDHLCKLQSFGYLRVDCVEKRLACGDVGLGAMASVDTIVDRIVENLLRPIPKLASPIKTNLLNQQPTYPIMSTSDTAPASKSSNLASLAERYRQNFNSVKTGGSKGTISLRNSSSHGQSLLLDAPKIENLFAKRNNLPLLSNINSNTNGSRSTTINNVVPRHINRPNLVKSLKNLKAINSEPLNMSVNDDILDNEDDLDDVNDDDEFFTDASLDLTMNNNEAEDLSCSVDPSGLLEQSLITDDGNSFVTVTRRSAHQLNNNNNTNRSSTSNSSNWTHSFPKAETSYGPLFNTSKFLTMCYVKERNCFNCAICKNDYKNRKSMSRHLREQHVQGNIYKCVRCDVGFKRREKLIKHNRDKHQQ